MTFLQSTAASVRDSFQVCRRHRLLIGAVFSVLMVASLLVITKLPRSYQATANVLIVNGNSRNDPTLSSPDLPSIVGSTAVLARVQQDLHISTPLLTLKKNLIAKPPAYRSGIMRIQYSDTNRDRAALVANGIADELARYYSELSTARYDEDLRALDTELARQKQRLQTIDAQIRAQGGDYLPIDPADEKDGDTSGNPVGTLESARAVANANLQGDLAHAQAASLDARRDVLLGDPLYQQLETGVTKAAAELADARSRYKPDYPGFEVLQTRVDSLRAAAAKEAARVLSSAQSTNPVALGASADERTAQASVEADRAKIGALDDELTQENQKLRVASSLELLRLARDEALREYQSIAAHRAMSLADRADALSLGSVEVVDRAIPSEEQVGIGPIRLTITVALISLIIAVSSAFVADQLDPRLRRATQIEELYRKPLIATLRTTTQRDTK